MSSAASVNISQVVTVSAKATVLAVLQIVIICASGFVVAWLGYLDKRAQRMLNNLNLNLFTPALIISKIAFSLDSSKLKSLALVPAAFVLFTAVSTFGAWGLAKVCRLSAPRTRFVMGCAMAVNSNSLPIALIQSLAYTVPALKQTPDESSDEMLARGISYLIIYSTLGLVWRYSFMVQFLAKANEDPVNDDDDIEKKPLGNSRDRSTNATAVNTANNSTVELKLADPQERNVELKGQDSLQIVELPSVPEVSSTASGVEPTPKAETRTKIWTKRIIVGVWEITTPALVAAIVSLVIVGAKPVQKEVLKAKWLTTPITQLGAVSIPLTLVVLGAYFVQPKLPKNDDGTEQPAETRDATERRTVVASVFGRMILTPILLFPILTAFVLATSIKIFDDPIFVLAMALLIAGPTAVTMAQLTSKSGAGPIFERMISSVIFWSYVFILVPMTILSALIAIILSTTPSKNDMVHAKAAESVVNAVIQSAYSALH